ncbi:MAG: GNAT family N-acetyltransferase [Chlorobi bacterium]|nr:GNAT family N-acetyltransferase [Chlorobiota bacterium]
MAPVIRIKSFDELTKDELYRLLQLRAAVFVTEQNCPYLDPDGKDLTARHLLLYDEGTLAGYARLFGPGEYFPNHAAVGRVVTDPAFRKRGYGYRIMEAALEELSRLYPGVPVEISAQTYLIPFYQKLGFRQMGNAYLEDGIPHVRMIRIHPK